jgi:hypothetical protein
MRVFGAIVFTQNTGLKMDRRYSQTACYMTGAGNRRSLYEIRAIGISPETDILNLARDRLVSV